MEFVIKNIKIMKCMNCDKFIARKSKIQKYCCSCNSIVARRRSKEVRDGKKNEIHAI